MRRSRDLEGRRVGVAGLPSDDAVLRAIVEADGGRAERVRTTTLGFSAVPALVTGRLDAATASGTPREWRCASAASPPASPGSARTPRRVIRSSCSWSAARPSIEIGDASRRRLRRSGRGPTRLDDSGPALAVIGRASGADPGLVRAQFAAVRPALAPPVRLDRQSLEAWADFAEHFGILRSRPKIDRAFDLEVAAAP